LRKRTRLLSLFNYFKVYYRAQPKAYALKMFKHMEYDDSNYFEKYSQESINLDEFQELRDSESLKMFEHEGEEYDHRTFKSGYVIDHKGCRRPRFLWDMINYLSQYCHIQSLHLIKFISVEEIFTAQRFIKYEERNRYLVYNNIDVIVSVSHRWMDPHYPDPDGNQLQQLKEFTKMLDSSWKIGFFYDYSSLPQENFQYFSAIGTMFDGSLTKPVITYIARSPEDEYTSRTWCIFELILMSSNYFNIIPIQFMKDLPNFMKEFANKNKLDQEHINMILKLLEESKVTCGGDKEIMKREILDRYQV